MAQAATQCAHCGVAIVDPTTQVVHGDMTYCCTNCSQAMEQGGSGSDPNALSDSGAIRCAHCGAEIVHDQTMEERGGQIFCCGNCAAAMSSGQRTA